MDPLPDVVPISELRSRQQELLEKVSEEPILLPRYGKEVAVLLGPELYNRILERLEDLQLALDVVKGRAADTDEKDFEDHLTGGAPN